MRRVTAGATGAEKKTQKKPKKNSNIVQKRRLLTLPLAGNRAVSVLLRGGRTPDAQCQDEEGKVHPPPPGPHDARELGGGVPTGGAV